MSEVEEVNEQIEQIEQIERIETEHKVDKRKAPRTEKQLEVLKKARENALKVRQEKAKLRKEQSVEIPEPVPTPIYPNPTPLPAVVNTTNIDLTQINELIDERIQASRPKKKFRFENGYYILNN